MSSVAFSVISAIIAVVALIQTQSQIKLSNKHQLFERRLNNFFAFYGLYELYKENKVILERTRKDEPLFAIDNECGWLTNNSNLEVCMEAMQRPNSSLARNEFLTKMEELKKLAMESRLIFPKDLGEKMALFIPNSAKGIGVPCDGQCHARQQSGGQPRCDGIYHRYRHPPTAAQSGRACDCAPRAGGW